MLGLAKGPKSSVMHAKIGGGKAGKSYIPSMPAKAANPYKQAKTLVRRATGLAKMPKSGGPY